MHNKLQIRAVLRMTPFRAKILVGTVVGMGREFAVAFQRIGGGNTGGYTELYLTTSVASASVTVRIKKWNTLF